MPDRRVWLSEARFQEMRRGLGLGIERCEVNNHAGEEQPFIDDLAHILQRAQEVETVTERERKARDLLEEAALLLDPEERDESLGMLIEVIWLLPEDRVESEHDIEMRLNAERKRRHDANQDDAEAGGPGAH